MTVADFDGVMFHLSNAGGKTKILLSISIKCFPQLAQFGAVDLLNREYKDFVTSVEPGYSFSLLYDIEKLPANKGSAGWLRVRRSRRLPLIGGRVQTK